MIWAQNETGRVEGMRLIRRHPCSREHGSNYSAEVRKWRTTSEQDWRSRGRLPCYAFWSRKPLAAKRDGLALEARHDHERVRWLDLEWRPRDALDAVAVGDSTRRPCRDELRERSGSTDPRLGEPDARRRCRSRGPPVALQHDIRQDRRGVR